ncbi:RsmB/NOP family class I SAM-dependent RNA methyltransferase [Cohnella faecalis]|uniref:rRNA cytosine-C5-methyltransferase n=1 Tax=Cohnella faecalis TaxID=2315694 RepID=A0A398CNY3_9BACL|nr:RsmB/NOP family class I SAM-dependent RNA methyltransferase [Cohnella faecalis]RIE00634.1 rRNA cytosine-C5-methyltransferase [Cohnella faecalis]
MALKLPALFITEMNRLLEEEADEFFATYNEPKHSGLRANGLKLTGEALRDLSPLVGPSEIPWADGGYYTSEEIRPGKHLYYHLGLYYIQEPSAMLPAELLGVRPGDRVLDLCAAPGGKTTQLAAKLQGQGVLVTNDNAAERTKALAKNVELAGIRNAVVLNEEPGRIADAFGAWFDRVLVDAPCSGEGMFRKDEDMIGQWERHSVERCSRMQDAILLDAARLVAPGGRLVYSTCTFSPRENEGTIAKFLAARPDFFVVSTDLPASFGFAPGRPDWLNDEEKAGLDEPTIASLAGTVRVWPHRSRGEGHFAALLERRPGDQANQACSATLATDGASIASAAYTAAGTLPPSVLNERDNGTKDQKASNGFLNERDNGTDRRKRGAAPYQAARQKPAPNHRKEAKHPVRVDETEDVLNKFEEFVKVHLNEGRQLPVFQQSGRLLVRGASIYLVPAEVPVLSGMNVVRPGWLLGSATKHRFEPSQAWAMGLTSRDAVRSLRLSSSHPDSLRYLKGETLQPAEADIVGPDGITPVGGKGWTLVCIDGFPAGWGRYDGTLLKNERLPGWRWV